MQSYTEENYLKEIYHLSQNGQAVQTNAIAEKMQTKAASVTDMIKKLSEKDLVNYIRYQGVTLTRKGEQAAISIVRKHRLWEVFLVDKLQFKWDEVHDVAEELEHIKSNILIERLDAFLGHPKFDPHGDPIPDQHGKIAAFNFDQLSKLKIGDSGTLTGVTEHSSPFLKHLEKLGLTLGKKIVVQDVLEFDGSIELKLEERVLNLSKEVSNHLLVSLS
ncbi:MAG: metal-dependent transcriptional regulator [Pedobacter sp.]|nr:MAG: metal-dependent transcriptional regulator [Pedobacter sp.]